MSRCEPKTLDHFVEPDAVRAYDGLWAPGARPVLCVTGWSGSGKTTLLCYLRERHDTGRVRVLVDLVDGRLAEGHRLLDELGGAHRPPRRRARRLRAGPTDLPGGPEPARRSEHPQGVG